MLTIEFHTAYTKVYKKLIEFIREEITKLANLNKEIVRAEVTLREDKTITSTENKICEVRLTVYGDTITAHCRTESFKMSAVDVLGKLRKKVKDQVKNQKDVPDVKISTVKV